MDRYERDRDWQADLENDPGSELDEDKNFEDDGFDTESFSFSLWLQTLYQHPLIFWGGIWTVVLLIAALAVTSLMNPSLSTRVEMKPDLSAETPAVPRSSDDEGGDNFSIWSLVVIAAGCALGSKLLSHHLETKRRSPQWAENTRSEESLAPPPPQLESAAIPLPLPPSMTPTEPVSASANPVVTVVPDSESMPLDWDEASLADLMDIRRRQSISSWLQ